MRDKFKTLYILRGLPGSGKSTAAEAIAGGKYRVFEADQYHVDEDGNYNWKPENVKAAHEDCQFRLGSWMEKGLGPLVVSNTSTTEKELKPYFDLAEKHGYTVFSLIVENRHGNKNVHEVPEETIEKMRNRFSIKL